MPKIGMPKMAMSLRGRKMHFPSLNSKLPRKNDWEGDGIPNFRDCQPRNIMRQDFAPFKHGDKETELTAAKRFGGANLQRLKKIGSGRDRTVYALDKDKVLKVAKNPGGLTQNQSEKDLDYLELGKHYETGLDYSVTQRNKPLSPQGKRKLANIRKDVDSIPRDMRYNNQSASVNAHLSREGGPLEKSGIGTDILSYDFSAQEMFANRQWGEDEEGNLRLNDAGSLNPPESFRTYRVKDFRKKSQILGNTPWELKDWDEVQRQRRQFKDKGVTEVKPSMPKLQTEQQAQTLGLFLQEPEEFEKKTIPIQQAYDMRSRYWDHDKDMKPSRDVNQMKEAIFKKGFGDEEKGKVPIIQVSRRDFNEGKLGDGKHRILAAQELGMDTIPIEVENEWKEPEEKYVKELYEKRRFQGLTPDTGRIGASQQKQEEWQDMSSEERTEAREELPDTDGDRVPDEYDCEPDDVMEQGIKSNRLMRQRIDRLPVFYSYSETPGRMEYNREAFPQEKEDYRKFRKQEMSEEDFFSKHPIQRYRVTPTGKHNVKVSRILSKQEIADSPTHIPIKDVPRKNRVAFYSAVKRTPHLISEIENNPDVPIVVSKNMKKDVRGDYSRGKGINAGKQTIRLTDREDRTYRQTTNFDDTYEFTLFHEYGHKKLGADESIADLYAEGKVREIRPVESRKGQRHYNFRTFNIAETKAGKSLSRQEKKQKDNEELGVQQGMRRFGSEIVDSPEEIEQTRQSNTPFTVIPIISDEESDEEEHERELRKEEQEYYETHTDEMIEEEEGIKGEQYAEEEGDRDI